MLLSEILNTYNYQFKHKHKIQYNVYIIKDQNLQIYLGLICAY